MGKHLILVRQKQNSEQDLIIIKARRDPIGKKRKASQHRFDEH